jgi:alkylhydroperoxidase family enzyme
MANLPLLEKTDVGPEARDLLDNFADLHRVMIHSPEALRRVLGVGRYVRHQSPLPARLRELAILRVSYLLRSDYQWTHHLALAEACGISDADIRGVIVGGSFKDFDADTRAVLLIAEAMTLGEDVSPDMIADLRRVMSSEEVVDLVVAISHHNGLARTIIALGVEVEDKFHPWLARYPLPNGPRAQMIRAV